MKYFVLASLFFLCQCRTYQTASLQHHKADTLIKLYAFGLPNFRSYPDEYALAQKWGFYYEELGCVFTQQEEDSVDVYNSIAEKPLVAKYGKNWRRKFYRELRVVTASPAKAIEVLAFTEKVAVKWMEMERHGDSLFYHVKPTKHHGIYQIDIVGYQNKEWVSFSKFKVDCIDEKVSVTRKTTQTDTSYLTDNLYFNIGTFAVTPG